jgi:crotonobetainyl-CoA:carnitine CoA-transferase CaiB-like acyl-CoA transferase
MTATTMRAEQAPEPGSTATPPLAGLRVLDLSLLLPGPFCTLILADLGAEVIKVEPPQGDGSRHSPTQIHPVVNRNKRSIVLDLKTADGLARCLELAAASDVFIEGFRPGVVERLGVGYEQVRRVRPDMVYCSISGFGRNGPMAAAPGHDVNYLASSGALAYSGDWRRTRAQRSGLPVADLSASMYAAVSILAALRRRDTTGLGAQIDLAMSDCAMAFASVRGGESQQLRDEERLHLFPGNGLFVCADGRSIALGAVEDHFWSGFAHAVERYDRRLSDPKFATEIGRRLNGDELVDLLDALFRSATADEWLQRLACADVPAQKVLTLDEAARADQVRHRQVVCWHEGQRHVLFPALWDGKPIATVRSNAPALGQHSHEVIDEILARSRTRNGGNAGDGG